MKLRTLPSLNGLEVVEALEEPYELVFKRNAKSFFVITKDYVYHSHVRLDQITESGEKDAEIQAHLEKITSKGFPKELLNIDSFISYNQILNSILDFCDEQRKKKNR